MYGGRQSAPELVNSQIGKLGDPTKYRRPQTKAPEASFWRPGVSFFSIYSPAMSLAGMTNNVLIFHYDDLFSCLPRPKSEVVRLPTLAWQWGLKLCFTQDLLFSVGCFFLVGGVNWKSLFSFAVIFSILDLNFFFTRITCAQFATETILTKITGHLVENKIKPRGIRTN